MTLPSLNFAIIGAAGYVAPRHLRAIRDTGHRLVLAMDPRDAAGILDRFSLDAQFFTDPEAFKRDLAGRQRSHGGRVDYVSICSPNDLHDEHVRLALDASAHAICEKPLVLNPSRLDALADLEAVAGRRVLTVSQLRGHPALQKLHRRVNATDAFHRVTLEYVTARGPWYDASWKGSERRSGGLLANIGFHLFDLVLWLFGSVQAAEMHLHDGRRAAGTLTLERACVEWFVSRDAMDLPGTAIPGEYTTHRSVVVDGETIDFTTGLEHLHTQAYREMLEGRGLGIEDVRPSVELVHRLRSLPITTSLARRRAAPRAS